MNQPFEAGIEQFLLEGRLDGEAKGSLRMSPELRELQEKYLKQKAERQNMSLASSCFAMVSPIMPMGLLSMLFVLGKLDGMEKDPEALAGGKNFRSDIARMAAAEALRRKKRENGEDPETNSYLRYASRELQLRTVRMAMRPLKGAEKKLIPKQQSREPLNTGFFMTREKQVKMREIKRQKILLEGLKDKESESEKPHEASRLSQKLEMLDKLLRKMNGRSD